MPRSEGCSCDACGCRRFEVYDGETCVTVKCVGCGKDFCLGQVRPGEVSAGVHESVESEAEKAERLRKNVLTLARVRRYRERRRDAP